jgi:sec-independent protein translocase protein TatB
MGKARKMAAEFQGQFQEAMREAEMADLKKSFDEVKEAATGFTGGNIMTSLEKDVGNALRIDDIDKPAVTATETPAISGTEAPAASVADTPAAPAETSTESETYTTTALPITPAQQDPAPATPDVARDARAS